MNVTYSVFGTEGNRADCRMCLNQVVDFEHLGLGEFFWLALIWPKVDQLLVVGHI